MAFFAFAGAKRISGGSQEKLGAEDVSCGRVRFSRLETGT